MAAHLDPGSDNSLVSHAGTILLSHLYLQLSVTVTKLQQVSANIAVGVSIEDCVLCTSL